MSFSDGYEFIGSYRGLTIKHKVLSDLGETTLLTYLENNDVLIMSENVDIAKFEKEIDVYLNKTATT